MTSAALVVAALVVWGGAGGVLAVTDFRHRVLPTRIIWPTAGVVWVLYTAASLVERASAGLLWAAVGGAACGAALAVVHVAHPPSLGFGDVRLGVLNGLLCGWWGWQAALAGLMAGFLLALPEALITLVREGARASRPLGHYLLAGAAAVAIYSAVTRGLIPFG